MSNRRALFAAIVFILGLPIFARAASSLPHKAAPAGLVSVDGPSGGRLVTGTLAGVTNPNEALAVGLRRMHGYFDRSSHVNGIVRSADGTTTIGSFTSQLEGERVQGVVLAAYASHVTPRIAVIYDRVGHLAGSIRPLLARLASIAAPTAHAAAGSTPVRPLHSVTAPDGTVSIAIPSDWKIKKFEEGVFVGVGPDGAEVDQELALGLADPRSPLAGRTYPSVPYRADPVQALEEAVRVLNPRVDLHVEHATKLPSQGGFMATRITGTENLANGVAGRIEGIIGLSPLSQYGAWSITLKTVAAPVATYASEFPTLTAIFNSYQVDQGRRTGQVQNNIAQARRNEAFLLQRNADAQRRNEATFEASMSHARSVQDSIDRSTAGYVNYLSNSTVVQNTSTGASATVGQNFGSALVRSDPSAFREVPVSEYRKGVDF